MNVFSDIFIIYNPVSTGDSEAAAKELEQQLAKSLADVPIKRIPTSHAGHAETLARELVKDHKKPLIVSSSGDGGYHEVVNGIMAAGNASGLAVAAVLPAGNANDHSRTMQEKPLWEAIKAGKTTKIDLLKMHTTLGKESHVRYAHSYIGLGLTPVIAAELNRHTLTAFKELFLVVSTFLKHRPFRIRRGSTLITLDSLVLTNINEMAKVLTLAKENRAADGKFEVISFPHAHKLQLITKLFKAATVGLTTTQRESTYRFEVIKDMPAQLDGEISMLKAGSTITVESAPKALTTIL